MQVTDRYLSERKRVTESAASKISTTNRQIYQRLKLSLCLGLRRQVLIAVCDDLPLRDRLAAQLRTELGQQDAYRFLDQPHSLKIVTLRLNLRHPNPLAQIAQWLTQHPNKPRDTGTLSFQLLGIERLTQQQPALQYSFLSYLRDIDSALPTLDFNLLLWVPKPWLRSIEESAPEFWNWRTGVFEFEGDPKPAVPISFAPSRRPSKPRPQILPAKSLSEALLASEGEIEPEEETTLSILESEADAKPIPAHFSLETAQKKTPSIEEAFILDDTLSEVIEAEVTSSHLTPVSPSKNSFILDFSWLKQQSKVIAELVDLVVTTATPNESLKTALAILQSIQTLQQQVESDQRKPASVAALVSAYQNLGDLYRNRIEQGEASSAYLITAIRAYEQVIECLDPTSPQVPDILNDIGNLYWMLSRYAATVEEKLPHLELGIHAYHAALMSLNPVTAPQSYAMIQNNLGAVYGDLARYREPAQNLQQSVLAYQEALRYRRLEADNPNDGSSAPYAATLNNLGTAYWNLAQHHQPVSYLKQAISAYTEALGHYSPERNALDYAMIQNNLGTAYWNLAQYEKPEDYLLLAISAYQSALMYRTPATVPNACAATQNNLGTAYWHLAELSKGKPKERFEFLEKAISAYGIALKVAEKLTPDKPLSFDIFATHNNLGLAHYQIAIDPQVPLAKESRSGHLETSLRHHLIAIKGWQNQPDFYQTALSFVVQTIRAFYTEFGIQGQNLALSKLPPQLLPEIMKKL